MGAAAQQSRLASGNWLVERYELIGPAILGGALIAGPISGIILIGGLMKGASGEVDLAALLGTIAVFVASINVFGGFLVTHRMLKMFRK